MVFVLDGSNSLSGERNAMNDLAILEKELELFKKDYSSKRRIIAVNKSDVDKEVFEMNFEEVKYKRTCDLIIPISARTGWNLSELVNSIRKIMEETSK